MCRPEHIGVSAGYYAGFWYEHEAVRSIAITPALDGAQSHLRNVVSQHFFMFNFPIKLKVPIYTPVCDIQYVGYRLTNAKTIDSCNKVCLFVNIC